MDPLLYSLSQHLPGAWLWFPRLLQLWQALSTQKQCLYNAQMGGGKRMHNLFYKGSRNSQEKKKKEELVSHI